MLHQDITFFTGYFSDNVLCHFVASMISGLVTTAASMPVDIAKTRLVTQWPHLDILQVS